MFNLLLPDNSTVPLTDKDGVIACGFGYPIHQKDGVADLLEECDKAEDRTANHYSEQWGAGVGFLQFIKSNPEALRHMPSGQLGWLDLLSRIRKESDARQVLVYDAACGYGGLFSQLFADPAPRHLHYLGADIHRSLSTIERPLGVPLSIARFVRWDVSKPLPIAERFDYVICRNALMHTPDPRETLRSLVQRMAPGGTIAVSLYARKALLREMLDDALRKRIVPLPVSEAFSLAHEFTLLGRDLRSSQGRITIQQDLPFFGIKAGEYEIQAFIYDHVVKCWYNDVFGERYSDVVNFDWYHPPHAHRFAQGEILAWFAELGLEITKTDSIPAQYYFEAVMT